MKKWYMTQSERIKCFKCGKINSTMCSLTESGLEVRIPCCDEHYFEIKADKFKIVMQLIKDKLKE